MVGGRPPRRRRDRLAREETRATVTSLLADDRAPSFAEACVWADAIRGDPAYEWARPHHYINVPEGASSIELARDGPPDPGGVVGAIRTHAATLGNRAASPAEKREALTFLAHFVGDVHQPLHAGRAADRGGTDIAVRFFGAETTRHAVWDGGIIERTGRDWETLAERLQTEITDAERVTWQSLEALDWAEESHRLAEMRAYRKPEDGWDLGPVDVERNWPEVAEQLKKAGYGLPKLWKRHSASDGFLEKPRGLAIRIVLTSPSRRSALRIAGCSASIVSGSIHRWNLMIR